MSQITITIDTPDTLERRDFAFEIDEALRIGFEHEYDMWTVEPKRGRWIENEKESEKHIEKIYICSNCHGFEAWGEYEKSNYCPNCGAKMEK